MNNSLIHRWTSVVARDDTVYHLGDFAMGDKALWAQIVARLEGRKILIRGNHVKVKAGVVNVGVDVWSYRPVTLREVLERHAQGDHVLC